MHDLNHLSTCTVNACMCVFVVDAGASGILVEPVQLQWEARGSPYTGSGERGF